MFLTYRGSLVGILMWQWKMVLLFLVSSSAIAVAQAYAPHLVVRLPQMPLAVVGGAIGIFVSFRTNSAYQRWWEGRQLWGRLINTSRHLASQVLNYAVTRKDEAHEVVRRHVGYVHVQRMVLRVRELALDTHVKRYFSDDEIAALQSDTNAGFTLLHRQLAQCAVWFRDGVIDAHQLRSLDETIRQFLDIQGGCERIKKTPFPRAYGYIAERLIMAYSVLLPAGLVADLGWFTVPITMLVCMAFILMSEVGRTLEDPFTLFWPALPLHALSVTIERDLLSRIGEKDIPPPVAPDKRGILM